MKNIILAVLCLCLVGCGTFDVKVQVVPTATVMAPATLVEPSPIPPTPVAVPTQMVIAPTATEVDPNITLTNIQMSDDIQGWGVTSSGRIVKTANRGAFWHDVTPPEGKYESGSLFALSTDTAWAVPANLETVNRVWRTRDGGSNWEISGPIPVGAGFFYTPTQLLFPDDQHGWLLVIAENGEQTSHLTLYKSDNGGADWMQITSISERLADEYLPAGTNMAFFDGDRGWMGGAWAPDDPSEWRMLKTEDGGTNWTTDTFRLPQQKDIACDGRSIIDMPPGSLAVEVTCTIPKDQKYEFHHVYYLSKETSREWHNWPLPGKLLSIAFANINQGWMLVTSDDPTMNKLLSTTNGGDSWKTVNKLPWKNARLNFISAKIGWAIVTIGSEASLFRTEDGGKTWIQIRPFISQ